MQVRISKPTKTATQSAQTSNMWILEFITSDKAIKFEPVMFRTSSTQMNHDEIKLRFASKEDAISYAKSKSYEYEVIEPTKNRIIKKSYADNFC